MKLQLEWVSDKIGNNYKQWTKEDTIIIDCQTGTGKSTFIMSVLGNYATENDKKILYLYNRKSLGNQLQKDVRNNNILLLSYQALANEIKKTVNKTDTFDKYDHYDYVVYDECHYLYHDSMFNNKVDYVYRYFFEHRDNKAINIFMSSTMDHVDNDIKKHFKNVQSYNTGRDYSYITPHHFENDKDIINTINNDTSGDKWMVFVPSISKGKALKHIINDSEFVCSTHNNKYNTKKNESILGKIERDEVFDCKCLITTKALDNGVNIKDDKMVNIVIFVYDRIDFMQMIGRKRVDITNPQNLNLYIFKITNQYLKFTHYLQMQKTRNMIKMFEEEYDKFCSKYNEDLRQVNDCMFRVITDDQANKLRLLNEGKPKEEQVEIKTWEIIKNSRVVFILKYYYLNTYINSLKSNYNHLLTEQLSWLGFKYDDSKRIKDVKSTYEVNLFKSYITNISDKKLFVEEQEALCLFMQSELNLNSRQLDKRAKKLKPDNLETIIRHHYRLNFIVEYGNRDWKNNGKSYITIKEI